MLGFLKGNELGIVDCPKALFLSTDHLDEQTILRGSVKLTLRQKRRVHLTIELVGKCALTLPERQPESKVLLHKVVSINEEEELPIGVHIFRFELELLNTSPASVSVLEGSIAYTLRATATGLATLGYDLVQEQPIAVAWSPGGEVLPPPGIEFYIKESSDELGSYSFDVWSPALSVGGILSSSISCSGAKLAGSTILSLVVLVRQKLKISSLSDPENVYAPSPDEFLLTSTEDIDQQDMRVWYRSSSGDPLCPPAAGFVQVTGQAGEHRTISRHYPGVPENLELVRLPNDQELAPSTHKDDKSPIQISHDILLRIVYRNKEGRGRMATITKPLPLTSCTCMSESLTLPSYSSKQRKGHLRSGLLCVCSESMAELVEENREAMLAFSARCEDPQRYTSDREHQSPVRKVAAQ